MGAGKLQCTSQPLHSEVVSKTNKKSQGSKEGATGCSSTHHSNCRLPDTTINQSVKASTRCNSHSAFTQQNPPEVTARAYCMSKKPILTAEGKRPSRGTGLLTLMQPPEQQLLARSQEAANQSTDVLFLPRFLCSLRMIFISIWAIHRKIVNTAVITLPLLPFPNNANFKGILVASYSHQEEASSAPPEFTLGKTRAIDLKTATFI